MADTTISQLPAGIPSNAAAIPFSQGGATYSVAPGALLQNAGNIGLGVYPAGYPLEIVNTSNPYILLRGGNNNSLALFGGTVDKDFSLIHSGVGKDLSLAANNGRDHICIKSAGNVGIGTNAPQAKLDVNGTIKATALQVPGCVLQVVQAYKTDIWNASTAGIGWEDVPGLSVSITLKSATSKVLINASVAASKGGEGNDALVRIMRVTGSASVAVGGGANPASTFNNAFGQVAGQYSGKYQSFSLNTMYLDTPAGVTSTYKIQFYNNGPQAARVNCRALFDDFIVASHITLQEVAQ